MRNQIQEALADHGADYVEIRLEERRSTNIRYRGRQIEEIGHTTGQGGCVRAAVKGGWGFVCFNSTHQLRERVTQAISQAKMVGNHKSLLARVDPIVDIVPATLVKDPSGIPIAEKKRILDYYNDLIWATPRIQSSLIAYGDSRRKTYFASSEGTYIEQEGIDVSLRISAMARDGGDIQQAGISLGSNGDFGLIEGLEKQVEQIARRAGALLDAAPIKAGKHTVVLDPILAGVFIHEAFGHLSEADHIYENDRMKEIMVLGRRFGDSHLNVVDGGAISGLRGSYKYDDEGVRSSRTQLIQEGILTGRLHSRETAAKMDETPSGNARAINCYFPPIVRMTNTFIEAGDASFEDLIGDIKEGVYVRNWYGGMTSMEMFTFSAGEAFMIRKGRVEEMVRPVMLSGNLFTTLENLDGVGNDLEMNQGGGCGKNGQSPLPVSNGSPHIRIRDCLISGS